MKNFIQNRLRLMLESFDTTLSEAIKYSTKKDLERLNYTLVNYEKYTSDPYFMTDSEGDSILRVSINQHGVVASVSTAKASADTAKSNLGLQSDKSGNYKVFHVMAGRGIEHPGTHKDRDHDAKTRRGVEAILKPGSPASDAVIKTYLIYGGNIIKDFIRTNMKGDDEYTVDGSGAEIAAAKNSPELSAKVQGKMDLLNKQKKKPISLRSDINKLIKQKEELTDKLKDLMGNDKSVRDERKKVQKDIKSLTKKINDLGNERSLKKAYLDSKK